MKTWTEVKVKTMNLDELVTLDDILERNRSLRPRIKGRIFKANQRATNRWFRNLVNLCECGRDQQYVGNPKGLCPYGYCEQEYCPDCGRIWGAYGPAGCLCDSRRGGHQRLAEQPKPRLPKKYRDRRPKALHYWEKSENVGNR